VPLLGAVVGPLTLVAVHLVIPPLPGGRIDDDHYTLSSDRAVWLLVALLGLAAGALVGRRRATVTTAPTARTARSPEA
jgi:hypothetical protein